MSLRPGLLEPDTDSETRLIGQICGKYLIFKIKILWISLNEIHEKFGPPDKTDIYIYIYKDIKDIF